MHIEIRNYFSFWGFAPGPHWGFLSPDPLHRTSPTFCTRFTPLESRQYMARAMGGATSFKPCMLISSPSLPSFPSPSLPS